MVDGGRNIGMFVGTYPLSLTRRDVTQCTSKLLWSPWGRQWAAAAWTYIYILEDKYGTWHSFPRRDQLIGVCAALVLHLQ